MANKKKPGVKSKTPAKTKKQPEKEIDTNNGKVVKFEKKTPVPDFNGQITYIKIPVKKEIPIIMYKRENDRGTKETKFKSIGRATDDFIKALQNLCPYFLNICEIPNKEDETIITGVSFTKNGIIIMGEIELTENGLDTSIPVNTPNLNLDSEKSGYVIPEYAKNLIDELKRQAILYMNGDAKEVQTEIPGIKEG